MTSPVKSNYAKIMYNLYHGDIMYDNHTKVCTDTGVPNILTYSDLKTSLDTQENVTSDNTSFNFKNVPVYSIPSKVRAKKVVVVERKKKVDNLIKINLKPTKIQQCIKMLNKAYKKNSK